MTTAMAAFLPCRQLARRRSVVSAPNLSALPDAPATRPRRCSSRSKSRPKVSPGPEAGSKHAKSDLMAGLHRRVYPQTPGPFGASSTDSPKGRTIRRDIRRLPTCGRSIDICDWHSSPWSACWVLTVPAPAVAAVRLPTPAGWPLSGSPVVQRGFDPPTVAWGSGHRGIDLAAKPGDAVLAAADGRVAFVGSIAGKPVISLDHGPVRTTYEPVISTLQVGERVALGQVIGQVGQGGHCRGCLHWGLREGKKYLNPLLLLGNGSGQLRLVAEAQRTIAERAAQGPGSGRFGDAGWAEQCLGRTARKPRVSPTRSLAR